MTKKNKDQKDVTLEQKSKDSSSSTFAKIKSSFSNTVQNADDLVHPKAGKITYLVFKIMTILTFTVGVPLFVLFYQFSIIDDAYTFENNPVLYSKGAIERSLTSSQQFTYEAIDSSIAEIENLTTGETFVDLNQNNVFLTSYQPKTPEAGKPQTIEIEISDGYSATTNSYFYSIFTDTSKLSFSDWKTNSQSDTFFATVSKDDFNKFLIDNSSYSEIKTTTDAQEAFRVTYPPQKYIDSQNSDIFKNGVIGGFVLVGVGIILGLLWFWFSKFAKVPLKTPEETKEQK